MIGGLHRKVKSTVQVRTVEHLCDGNVTVSYRDGCMELTPLTTGGTYAMVAKKSQTRPWQKRNIS
jgi:hypothetical protein